MNDRLPFIPDPLPNELLSSWLCRISDLNYLSYVEFLRNISETEYSSLKVVNKKRIWIYDLDRELPDDILRLISVKMGLNEKEILKMTLSGWKNRLYELFITNHKTKDNGGLRFCPKCLESDEIPYYRKEWKLKFVTCCPIHDIYLLDRCPNPECNKAIKLSLIKHKMKLNHCVYCGYDLSKAQIKNLPKNDSYKEFLKNILSKLNKNESETETESKFKISTKHPLYLFFEAFYFMSRFIIAHYAFDNTKYQSYDCFSSDNFKILSKNLKQRDNVFENLEISHIVLGIAYELLQNEEKLAKIISRYQTEFNYYTEKDCPKILEEYRNSKGNNPVITQKRIKSAIDQLILRNINLSYKNIAKEAKCTENFYLSHPDLKKYADDIRNNIKNAIHKRTRKVYKVEVDLKDIIDAITKLQKESKKITYKSIGNLINEKAWNLQSKPEITRLIKPYLTNASPKKKYYFDEKDIKEILDKIKKLGLNISINEVCRQLNCHKTFFRNHPKLKHIILSEKRKQEKNTKKLLPNFNEQNQLSPEALKYEPLYIQYQREMELLGKNWRIANNERLSQKLGIPIEILIEIKIKYCPSTKNEVLRQKQKELKKKYNNNSNESIQLSNNAKRYEQKFIDYMQEMKKKGKSFKSARTKLLEGKLAIPYKILIEIKKKYCIYN